MRIPYYKETNLKPTLYDIYMQYHVEAKGIEVISEDGFRWMSKEDFSQLDSENIFTLSGNAFNTAINYYGSREFQTFFIKSKSAVAHIEDGYMSIYGEPDKELIYNMLCLMEELNIKRIIFACRKKIAGLSSTIREIKDVKEYHLRSGKFVEESVGNVYQIYNPKGKYFSNGPFQQCKICKNWFRYTTEEVTFFKEIGINGTKTCKRCKGRKVV